jgi:hypothetical protein
MTFVELLARASSVEVRRLSYAIGGRSEDYERLASASGARAEKEQVKGICLAVLVTDGGEEGIEVDAGQAAELLAAGARDARDLAPPPAAREPEP